MFSLKAAGNSNDYLANDMLSLLITLKIFIVNHNSEREFLNGDGGVCGSGASGSSVGASGAAVDIGHDEYWITNNTSDYMEGGRLAANNTTSNRDIINRLTRLDQMRLSNFHFINTLENLKMHLVKYRANRGNSSLTLRDDNVIIKFYFRYHSTFMCLIIKLNKFEFD